MKGKQLRFKSTNPKLVRRYADGGKVLPAARMDGGIFLRAAERAGLPTDNATLNQIVNLVNQGYSVARATSMVSSYRKGKEA